MRLPWQREKRESLTDEVVAHLWRTYTGAGEANVSGLGVAVAAAGVWSRSFAAAEVTPESATLSPYVLADIGRRLLLEGEYAATMDVFGSAGLTLTPARIPDGGVEGSTDPRTWRYTVEQDVPSTAGDKVLERKVNAAELVHIRLPGAVPWRGRSPLADAGITSALAASIERILQRESSSDAHGYLIPSPLPPDNDGMEETREGVGKLRGAVAFVETFWSGAGGGLAQRPQHDWRQVRVGMDPPDSLRDLRNDSRGDVLAACGVPPELIWGGGAAGAREGLRRFLHQTIQPVARLVEAELSLKLETAVSLSFGSLQAADVAGRARAYGSLIGADMPADEAKKIVGFTP